VKARHISKDEVRREYEKSGDGSYVRKDFLPVELLLKGEFVDGSIIEWQRTKSSLTTSRSTVRPNDIKKYAEVMANSADKELPVLVYQSAARVWSQKKEKTENVFRKQYVRTVGYMDTLEEASNLKMFLNWCVKMEHVSWKENKKISEYEAVKFAVGKFMSLMDHGDEYTVFYDRTEEGVLYREGDAVRPITDLSAGYQSLIWMVFDIAYRMAVLNPFMGSRIAETSGIVLVDEIDMHLHPRWQWKVLNALRETFPNVQFIVSSHSPIIMASTKDIWLVDLDKDEISYTSSSYGIDVNTSMQAYQNTEVIPEEIRGVVDRIEDALDNMDYDTAISGLEELESKISKESPLLTSLRTRIELETAFED
jgi:predicted ATP-binding protein involved in virulence